LSVVESLFNILNVVGDYRSGASDRAVSENADNTRKVPINCFKEVRAMKLQV